MGNCGSSDSTQVVATAKLVLQDGRLQEFSYPVKVSYLLKDYPACFICNSDEMDFDDVVSAVHEDEVLRPGNLYFVLPLSRLRHPLQAAEMAALAVKASAALMKSGAADRCGCDPKLADEDFKPCRSVSAAVGGGDNLPRSRRGVSRRGGGGGSRGKFTALLSSIPE